MSPRSKSEYLETIRARYRNASRSQKSAMLNEFCRVCHYHKKHAVRLLGGRRFTKQKPKKRGRKPKYNNPSVIAPLKRIWKTANLPCGKRLKSIIELWLPSYEKTFGKVSFETRLLLTTISASTIDRVLEPSRLKFKGKGRSCTKPGTLLKKHIPIKTDQWDETRPGFIEADTVAHCGSSLEGEHAWTLDCVDIATTWTEQRAVLGKGSKGVLEGIKDIEESLPFALLGFDSDNGSEFLNHHLWRYCVDRKVNPVQFTRSREYHSDDNAHIEQKNWTHVRQWLGYGRLDDEEVVVLMNELYTSEWNKFHNFFMPSVKLISKNRIGSKTIKAYDAPKTPYQRVLESKYIEDKTKEKLQREFKHLNPFELRKKMEQKLAKILRKPYIGT